MRTSKGLGIKPFNALEYLRVRNIPYLCFMAAEDAMAGEFRCALHILKTACRVALLALGLIALTGCTTTRYVQTYCLTKDQLGQLKAAKPSKVHDQLNGQADHDLKPIAGRLVRVEAWGDGLLTVLGGCVEPTS